MQCPRCCEEVADECTACPVCLKPLATSGRDSVRVALTGEGFQSSDVTDTSAPIMAHSQNPPEEVAQEQTAAPAPLRLIPTRADLFPAARKLPVSKPARTALEVWYWAIAGMSLVGIAASLALWRHPYVAPVLVATGAGQNVLNTEAERAIPAVYLWLWGCYGALAVAVQCLMPAPWRVGGMRMRTNWVLNITTIVTILVFMGTNTDQVVDRGETLTYQDGGGYGYRNGGATRTVAADEARQINERLIHNREAAIFKVWNMTAALAYLALGSYAVWWIVKRPEAEPVEIEFSVSTLLRQLRGEPEPEDLAGNRESVPAENTRTREPTEEKISWR